MSTNPIDSTNSLSVAQKTAETNTAENTTEQTGSSKIEGVSQQDFLMLLVNQLENQDPLDPMSSEEFAVQLAQFAQVEQLIAINSKLDNIGAVDSGNAVGSMASYLGHEVVLSSQQAQMSDGSGPNVLVDFPEGTQSARIDLINSEGATVASYSMEEVEAGRKAVPLKNIDVEDGSYDLRVVAVNESGSFVELDGKVTGTVEGFVLEPEPALIVNGEEVPLADVTEVYTSS